MGDDDIAKLDAYVNNEQMKQMVKKTMKNFFVFFFFKNKILIFFLFYSLNLLKNLEFLERVVNFEIFLLPRNFIQTLKPLSNMHLKLSEKQNKNVKYIINRTSFYC